MYMPPYFTCILIAFDFELSFICKESSRLKPNLSNGRIFFYSDGHNPRKFTVKTNIEFIDAYKS